VTLLESLGALGGVKCRKRVFFPSRQMSLGYYGSRQILKKLQN